MLTRDCRNAVEGNVPVETGNPDYRLVIILLWGFMYIFFFIHTYTYKIKSLLQN